MGAIQFSHVGIFVVDMDLMVRFYTELLGLVVSDRAEYGAGEITFLTGDARDHHQVVLASGRPPATPFNVVQQISFRVDGLATLRALHARLKREPIVELGPVTHGNAISAYFRDPEGNRVELFTDTPWYVPQPLAVPIDLSLPDTEIWARVERTARAQPGFRSRAEWEAEIRAKLAQAAARA